MKPLKSVINEGSKGPGLPQNGPALSTGPGKLKWKGPYPKSILPKGIGTAATRNRLKRQLRELWRARLARIPRGRDYVLIARPGVAEATESRGFDWLGERVDEVLQKAAA